MIRPFAALFRVDGRRQTPGLGPFLKRGLGIAGIGIDRPDPCAPEPQDNGLRRLETRIEIDGRDHRLHRVAEQRILAPPARHHLGPPQLQHVTQPHLARHVCTGFLAHQGVIARSEAAFGGVGIGGQQRLGHDEAQHTVAQKFQPLIVRPGRPGERGMGDRTQQQLRIAELMPEAARKGPEVSRQLHSTALKKRSARHVQKNSMDRPADENMIRSARPIRYSAGTKPTPPTA